MQLYSNSIIIFTMDLKSLINKYYKIILISTFLISSAVLRCWDLGYSDYIPDEFKSFMILKEGESISDFLLKQRKGPMQFLVGSLAYYFSNDYKNELIHRIPYTLISIFNVYLFYLIVLKITKNYSRNFEISIISSFIFSFNGFIFGFSRIAQYQNLNMLFSFISILIFFKILEVKKNSHIIFLTLLSTIFFIFSFLSHWDAVFYLPLLVSLIFYKSIQEKNWKRLSLVIGTFFFSCLLILGSMMFLYLNNLSNNSSNQEYLERRIEFLSSSFEIYYNYIVLYNPFLFLWILIPAIIYSLYNFKKNIEINIWFLVTISLFYLFFKKPGTHIYNFLIPAIIMMGIFLTEFWYEIFKKIPSKIRNLLLDKKIYFNILIILFLAFQTYILFVDSIKEYPYEQERVLFLKTKEYLYSEEEKLPLFGFPHSRKWNEINKFLLSENLKRGKNIKFMTNENEGIAKFYLDLEHGKDTEFYFIGIKNPQNFIKDMRPRQYKIKEKIMDEASPKTKIWLVSEKDKK